MTHEKYLEPGDTIHGYVVERLAAVGGAAAVYEARDPVLGRPVALKILRRAVGVGQLGWRGLEGEGRRTARLEHPAFVTVYEVFPHGDGSALVMEWVEGSTLAERLARGPMPVAEIREIFLELASALAVAHRAGTVHGDLSPANVMLVPHGGIKILDPAPPRAAGGSTDTLGTPPYAAPELARGKAPTPRADVHAFGAMLAEVLEHGTTGWAPCSLRRLRRLARRCTAPEPSRRPAGGGGLVEVLEPGGRRTGPRRRWVALTALAAAALVAAGFLAARWVERRDRRIHTVWNGMERLRTGGSLPALLEDGSGVLYRSRADHAIEYLPLGSGAPRTVWRGESLVESLAVAPDARSVLFSSPAAGGAPWLWEVAIEGGLPRRVAPGSTAAFSADGRRVAVIQPLERDLRRVVVLDRETGSLRTLHSFGASLVPVSAIFGPAGGTVIVVATDGVRRSTLLSLSLEDGAVRPIIEVVGVAMAGATLHRRLRAVVWAVRTEVRGEASLVVTSLDSPSLRVVYPGPGRASHPRLDGAGDLLSFQLTEVDTELVELTVNPGAGPPVAATEVLDGTRGASQPRIAPDPNGLLFDAPTGSIRLMDRSTGKSRPILPGGGSQYNPAWSPDGKLIACARLVDGRSDLWLVPAAGGTPERLTAGAGNNFQPVWHPDGRHILFVSDRDGVDDLYALELPGGGTLRLGRDGAVNPAISSDGRLVAYVVGATGASPRLRLARLDGAASSLETVWERPVVINRWAGAKARFSPDGRWLAFDQPRKDGGADIWVVPVDGGGAARAIPLTALPFAAGLTGWFDWGPDWKIVATVARRTDRICILHNATWWLEHAR